MSTLRALSLAFGCIILIGGIVLLIGGFGLYRLASTGEGQIIAVQSSRLEKRSYAIIFKDIDIMLENAAGGGSIRGRDFIDIELRARVSSNEASENVFIGIGGDGDVKAFLDGVNYDEITKLIISASRELAVEYAHHSGNNVPALPTSQTFWKMSVHGAGTQVLKWEPTADNYWIVLMNEDRSIGVDLTVTLRATVSLLTIAGLLAILIAVTLVIVGGVMIFLGRRR